MSSSIKTMAKIIKFVALFIIALLLIIWLSSPFVSRHYIIQYLNEHQLTLADKTTIRYNPFWSNLNIRELEITSVKNSDKPLVLLKSLNVTVSLFRLLTDTLYLSEFAIDGLYLDVDLNGEAPVIGGFVIARHSDDTSTSVETPTAQKTNLANNYQVSLPYFSLSNSVFNLGIEQSQQELIINSLVIKNVLASTKAQQAEIVLSALINKAPLLLKLTADLTAEQRKISSELTLSDLALAPLQPLLTPNHAEQEPLTLQGSVSINSKQSISLSGVATEINVETFELITADFNATQNNKTVALNIAPLTLQDLSIELIKEQAPKITGTATLNINDLMAYEGDGTQVLAKISAIKLADIAVTTTASLITANIANLIIEQSLFAENTSDNLPPLAQFNSLSINGIIVSQQGLLIDTINLLGLAIETNLDKEKNITGLPASPKDQKPVIEPLAKTVNSPETPEAQSDESSFLLSLNAFSFTDTAHINFIDRSTSPHYKRAFNITTFNAGPFDNQKPQQESHFTLTGSSDKYANFNLSAVAKPFREKDYYKLNGFFKEVSLPSLSTYIAQALNYELKSGQLDVDLDVTVDDKKITGKTKLLLRGVELGAANDHETGTVKSQTSVPFNIALGMLKDGDGNVELDIPLKGSTDDPSFGISGFISLLIKQATMSAAKEYLITTFVPYANVVNVAMSAGDYLLKVRFNDLTFPIKETQLTAQQSQFLTQFSALMTDKLETQLTLCAIATPEDIDKPLGTKITDIDDIKQLAEISEQRLEAFKEHMVKEQGIASSRLLLCSPKIDSAKGAKPRITFTD
ncbi:DUF748 domain-containing protein [Colwellia hornerae]|uniref:DUF748 domain-containing protein n=1 Tax=Colwellia hornerae TaxID=89402 RepID=A0A5C6QP86_9GAMM|nr:DUF748 domain-containing protein [Colwellia hornerae]TWX56258.1 DUF748 domain-containing protein [Colwellia hornerae]TWX62109.1 DUF748 domain-containing protein [Colwellia hornerae]TWX70511.1 DUF748 domain-containing protein [Colwellia hornerae]